MGAMGLTGSKPETASEAVREVRKTVGDAPFVANFVLAFPPDGLRAALGAGLPVVTFSWGDPTPYLSLCRSHGSSIGVQVANLDGAKAMLDLGVDFLIVQGQEAGGHVQSSTSLNDLLPSVIELGIPVIAAGGLVDGKDVRRVLDMGAVGAMLGTRFVATKESRAHEIYKSCLLEADRTAMTPLFDGDWPFALHRVLRNSTLEKWEAVGSPPAGKRPGEGEILGQGPLGNVLRYDDVAPRIGFTGRIEEMCLYAGTGVSRISDLPAAAELVRRIADEAGIQP